MRIDKGSRQGDTLIPNLCHCFLNPLLREIKVECINVKFGNLELLLLSYANDLAVVGENECDLQKLLKVTEDWCNRWRLKLNCTKSHVIHFKKLGNPAAEVEFKINNNRIDLVNSCQYSEVIFNEHLNYHESVNA